MPEGSRSLLLWRVAPLPDRTTIERCTDGSGRWHRGSKPIIYASTTPELAVLEALAHLERPIRQHWILRLILRKPVSSSHVRRLPRDWVSRQAATREIGERWLASGRRKVLIVPSALCADARNALIACDRLEPRQLSCRAVRPFHFDKRLIDGV
jgi:RES domain-containing protein